MLKKREQEEQVTNNELARLLHTGFGQLAKKIEHLALMTKQGFDDTPTKGEMTQGFFAVDEKLKRIDSRLNHLEEGEYIIQRVKEALAL